MSYYKLDEMTMDLWLPFKVFDFFGTAGLTSASFRSKP